MKKLVVLEYARILTDEGDWLLFPGQEVYVGKEVDTERSEVRLGKDQEREGSEREQDRDGFEARESGERDYEAALREGHWFFKGGLGEGDNSDSLAVARSQSIDAPFVTEAQEAVWESIHGRLSSKRLLRQEE